jgi:hypothetical protein
MNENYVTLMENTKEKEKFLQIANYAKNFKRFIRIMLDFVLSFYLLTFFLLIDIRPLFATFALSIILFSLLFLYRFARYLIKLSKTRNIFSNFHFFAIIIFMLLKIRINLYVWNKKVSYMNLRFFFDLNSIFPSFFSSNSTLTTMLLISIIFIVFSLAIYIFLLIWTIKREKNFSEDLGKMKIWTIISIFGLILSQTIFTGNFGLLMLTNFLGSIIEITANDGIAGILCDYFEHRAYNLEKTKIG